MEHRSPSIARDHEEREAPLLHHINPVVRGWMNYYGAFYRSALYPLLARINALWVPETLLTSRDLAILVEQSTKPVAPLDGVRILRRRLGEWS